MYFHTLLGVISVAALSLGGGTVTLDTPTNPEPIVNWIETSEDTLGDVIARAIEESNPDLVAAELEILGSAGVADSESLTGLNDLSEAQLDTAVAAVAAGDAMPDYLEQVGPASDSGATPGAFKTGASSNRSRDTTPFIQGAINNGFSYETTDYIRRGVVQATGAIKWTDRIDVRVVTDPSAKSTKFTSHLSYFPSTRYFNDGKGVIYNIWKGVRPGTGSVKIAAEILENPKLGATVKTLTHSQSVRGGTYYIDIGVYAMHRDRGEVTPTYYSSGQLTGVARCESDTNVCKF
ncbi:hypothetical protein [Pseudoclavibacter sp. JSM 162008]|uniref:hypothetical protein n=1 Tax=Pseudoclavibacter sp. JSM 162008 TaxID=3229855 RepID=UPI003523D68C